MKKFISKFMFSSSFFLAGAALVFFALSTSFASEANPDEVAEDYETFIGAMDTLRPSCLGNWNDWPDSDQLREEGNWSLQMIPGEQHPNTSSPQREYFIDVNGDGLLDYVYAIKYTTMNGANNYGEECVALNNGRGWDVVYRCKFTTDHFYGDCAEIEEEE